MRQIIIAAGCVALRMGEAEPEVLLIWTKQYPDPTLPKGHVEANESASEGALRELQEETGYIAEVLNGTPVTLTAILDKHPPVVHKTIHWFLVRVIGGAPDQRVEKQLITRVGWLPISAAIAQMKRPNEIEAIEKCLNLALEADIMGSEEVYETNGIYQTTHYKRFGDSSS